MFGTFKQTLKLESKVKSSLLMIEISRTSRSLWSTKKNPQWVQLVVITKCSNNRVATRAWRTNCHQAVLRNYWRAVLWLNWTWWPLAWRAGYRAAMQTRSVVDWPGRCRWKRIRNKPSWVLLTRKKASSWLPRSHISNKLQSKTLFWVWFWIYDNSYLATEGSFMQPLSKQNWPFKKLGSPNSANKP